MTLESTQEAIGIATHGGCATPGILYNAGTAIQHTLLQGALAAPKGCCKPGTPGSAVFQGLGDLPGGVFLSRARALSPDGNVVVGESSSGNAYYNPPHFGTEAFRWTAGSGMVGLGDLPGGQFNGVAWDVSQGGGVVVGWGDTDLATYEAFVWTSGGGMFSIGNLGSPPFLSTYSTALGVSAAGGLVVGESSFYEAGPPVISGYVGFQWTSAGGMTPLAAVGSFGNSRASGISDDGKVIFGVHNSLAAIFTAGMPVSLGELPGGAVSSYPLGASGDGSVIVGGSSSESSGFLGNEAFLWSSVTGMLPLGDLPDPPFGSVAHAVAANGAVVVGSANIDPFGGAMPRAFIWDSANGIRDLREVLIREFGLGAALSNWTLVAATGISSDGNTIAGTGFGPNGEEAWIVRLNVAAPACFGDIDGDGRTCQSDLGVLLAAFGTCECQVGYIARANLATSTPVNCPPGTQGIDQADLGVLLADFGCGGCP